jgi:hypothetical protein
VTDAPVKDPTKRNVNLVLIAGTVLLAFSALGYLGNFVQWADAPQTTARVLNAEKQWLRRGGGNFNLDISYDVNATPRQGKVSISASTLEASCVDGKIEVYYMKSDPDRVIPVAVLKGKQQTIYITSVLGVILTVAGLILRWRRKTRMETA